MINNLYFYQHFRDIYNTTIFKLYHFVIITFWGLDFFDKDGAIDVVGLVIVRRSTYHQHQLTRLNQLNTTVLNPHYLLQ